MRNAGMVVTVLAALAVGAPVAGQQAAAKNIVDVAAEAGTFKTLLAAAQAAGLAGVLTGEGPFTVFAPTDAAFAKLPAGTVESLLANPAQLAEILKYHVVPARLPASGIVATGTSRPLTVQGGRLNVRVVGGRVLVEGATVVAADVQASNGVIHVIDTVMLPPSGR